MSEEARGRNGEQRWRERTRCRLALGVLNKLHQLRDDYSDHNAPTIAATHPVASVLTTGPGRQLTGQDEAGERRKRRGPGRRCG
jgi:hypothetical protein